jgi:hypothetical protein
MTIFQTYFFSCKALSLKKLCRSYMDINPLKIAIFVSVSPCPVKLYNEPPITLANFYKFFEFIKIIIFIIYII